MSQVLSFNECRDLIANVGHELTVIVQGENGVGKTALAYAMAEMPQFQDFIKTKPIDCTQMSDGSIWMPDIDKELGISRELPNERFGINRKNQKGVNGSNPALICFDEIFKVPQFIKNMIAPIVHDRRIGEFWLPERSIVFGCTNLSVEGLGDSIQPHLRSRLCLVTMRKPTQQEWKENFAIPKRLNPALIACTEMNPMLFDSFLDYEPGGKMAGKPQEKDNPYIFNPRLMQDGFVSPRTLHKVNPIIEAMDALTPAALQAGIDGLLGKAGGALLASFVRFQHDLVPFERVVADPMKAPLTSNPTAQLVQTFQFITRTETREEASAVVKYVGRLKEEMSTLFCVNVANSSRIITFANAPGFNEMLAKNKIYLGGVK